jgi:hypothetical protein
MERIGFAERKNNIGWSVTRAFEDKEPLSQAQEAKIDDLTLQLRGMKAQRSHQS